MFDKLKQFGELNRLRQQATQIQRQLAMEEIVVDEQGVRVVMTGDQKIKELSVNGERNDRLANVLNKAMEKSRQVAAKKLQEMSGGLEGLKGLLGGA